MCQDSCCSTHKCPPFPRTTVFSTSDDQVEAGAARCMAAYTPTRAPSSFIFAAAGADYATLCSFRVVPAGPPHAARRFSTSPLVCCMQVICLAEPQLARKVKRPRRGKVGCGAGDGRSSTLPANLDVPSGIGYPNTATHTVHCSTDQHASCFRGGRGHYRFCHTLFLSRERDATRAWA